MDIARGKSTLFMRLDEVLAAWEFIDPLVDSVAKSILLIYRSGSMGPNDDLLIRDARHWIEPKEGHMMLIDDIATSLQDSLLKIGKVSIALSGGSSPVALYEGSLSSIDLEWARIRVTLIDDRLVAADHDDSNQKLVQKTLLHGKAGKAQFIGLQEWQEGHFPDIAILGMWTDGHFASFS